MQALLDLWQREDPTWAIEELARVFRGDFDVISQQADCASIRPGSPTALWIRVQMLLLPPNASRSFTFPTLHEAIQAEDELADFDTDRPGAGRELLVWSRDPGIDR